MSYPIFSHRKPSNSLLKHVFFCFPGVPTSLPKPTRYPYPMVHTLQILCHLCYIHQSTTSSTPHASVPNWAKKSFWDSSWAKKGQKELKICSCQLCGHLKWSKIIFGKMQL